MDKIQLKVAELELLFEEQIAACDVPAVRVALLKFQDQAAALGMDIAAARDYLGLPVDDDAIDAGIEDPARSLYAV